MLSLPLAARVRPVVIALIAALALFGASTSRAQSEPTLTQLFDQYRHGDADAAIETLASWPLERLEAETGNNPAPGDAWSDAAFAMFHTEAGFRNGRFYSDRPNFVGSGAFLNATGVHLRTSYRLMDEIAVTAKARADRRLLDVVKWWCVVAGSWDARMHWQREITYVYPLMERHFGDDPEVALFAAALLETRVGPASENDRGMHFVDVYAEEHKGSYHNEATKVWTSDLGWFNFQRVVDIEKNLQRALASDRSLVEARLRLGRLRYLTDRTGQATQDLEQTLREARSASHSFVGYLAGLFLGNLYERAGRSDAAIAAYGDASAFLPNAPAAHLALARVLLTTGRPDEGWAEARRVFGSGQGPHATDVDPWVVYPAAQWWLAPDRLRWLRATVRGEAPPSTSHPAVITTSVLPSQSEPSPAQTPQLPRTFRAAVDGVRIDVFVADGDDPVTGLGPDAFEIRDNGVRQTVVSAEVVGNLSVAIALDVSSSVGRSMPAVATAAQVVGDALEPADVASFLTFDERMNLRVRETNDVASLQRAMNVEAATHDTKTVMWDAALAAGSLAVNRDGRPVVVVVGDTADNASWLTQSPLTRKPENDRAKLIDLLARTGTLLDFVVKRTDDWKSRVPGLWDTYVGDLPTRTMLLPTGGQYFDVSSPDWAVRLKKQFANLRAGYVLTFTPTGVKKDDGWHKVTVQLRKGKGKVVAAPPGYYASEVKPKSSK